MNIGDADRLDDTVKLILVAVGVFATACFAIKLARNEGQISPVWLSNALIIAAMLGSRRQDKWTILLVGFLANTAADIAIGDPLVRVISLPVINAVEIAGCVGLLNYLRDPTGRLDLTRPKILTWFCLTILGPVPMISGVLAATVLSTAGVVRFDDALLTWYPSHALGLLAVTPLLLMPQSEDFRALRNPRHLGTFALVIAIYAATLAVIFTQKTYPCLFLLFPVAILVAFQSSFVGVALTIILTAATSIVATVKGYGPIMLAGGDLRHRILLLQLFLAVLVLTMIEVSAVLAHRKRLEHDLVDAKDLAECAERERAESEARYRLITERASDVIVKFKIDGTLTYVSQSAERVTGYPAAELLGTRTTDYTHPEDLDHVVGVYRNLMAAGPGAATPHVEYRCRKKDGRWIWIENSPTCLFDEDEAPTGFVDIVRDITRRKQMDAELRLARSQAEAASRAKSDFLASMSHEIRTPLNGIIGYADLLKEDASLNREQRKYVTYIETCGSALLTVVNDVLDFSRIEAGKVELDLAPVNLVALLDSAMSIVQGSARAKQLSVETLIDETVPPWIVGDEARLRQIILNLLNNAIKFTADGGIVFNIQGDQGALGEPINLCFRVEDTGIGIAPAKMDRLFKHFSQIDDSITRRFGGSGLGLAISRSLVELMGGLIGVESEEGRGSTFWFKISVPAAEAVATTVSAPPAEQKSARILLVEDLEINQQLAKMVLEAAGHRVTIVCDGAEAVAAVQADVYDIVLMDLQMPVMDGLTATRCIRALDHPCRSVPIVAMTANVLPAQIVEMRAAGMDDYVGKPFKRDLLYAAIGRSWQGKDDAPVLAHKPDCAIDDPIFDAATFDEIVEMTGRDQTGRLLEKFAAQIMMFRDSLDHAEEGRPLGREAHALISTSGALGFAQLSVLCRAWEQAEGNKEDVTSRLPVLRRSITLALQRIDTLRQAA